MKINKKQLYEQERNVKSREYYKKYYGEPLDQLIELTLHGRQPVSVKEVMKQQVIAYQSHDQYTVDFWLGSGVYTADAIFCHSNDHINEKMKVVPDALLIPALKSKILSAKKDRIMGHLNFLDDSYAIPISEDIYQHAAGYEFLINEEIRKRSWSSSRIGPKKMEKNPFWNTLVQEDKSLLREFIRIAFNEWIAKNVNPYNSNRRMEFAHSSTWGSCIEKSDENMEKTIIHMHPLLLDPFYRGSHLLGNHQWDDNNKGRDYTSTFIGVKQK